MTLKKNSSESADPKLEKIVSQLKEPAKRTKQVLQNAFEKSIPRFQDIASKSDSEKTKTVILRKIEKISSNLEILKVLSEDEIIRYALLKINKIIPIASNPRFPQEERMKARVAAHKPLSTHLARLKQKQIESCETTSESEDEEDTTTSTLNKITFNNIVVSMRKDVKRAKVFVIHKLTRTIKKLRMAKGKEEKVAKCLRKAERLHKKVIHIKELHEDEISKFALSTTQNVSQLATDIKAPTASQALAVMAVHEFVAAHVRDFKTKYPDWQKVVPNLLKKKNKKRKLNLETKDKKNLSELSQASGGRDNNTSESEKSENGLTESENDQSEDEHDHSESENYSSESEQENEKGGESDSENENENSENDSETNNSDLDSGSRNTLLNNHEADDSEVSRNKQNKGKSDRNVRKKNYKKNKLSEDSEIFSKTAKKIISKGEKEIEDKSSSLEVPSSPVKNKPKVIDPFFVTTTNEEYITSQVPPSNEITSSNENNKSFKTYSTRKPNSFDFKNTWERRGEERNYGKLSRFKESAPFEKHSARSFNRDNVDTRTDRIVFGNRKERRKALLQPKVEEKVEQLHPSWEAKRKQSNIKPFQGKKVKFD